MHCFCLTLPYKEKAHCLVWFHVSFISSCNIPALNNTCMYYIPAIVVCPSDRLQKWISCKLVAILVIIDLFIFRLLQKMNCQLCWTGLHVIIHCVMYLLIMKRKLKMQAVEHYRLMRGKGCIERLMREERCMERTLQVNEREGVHREVNERGEVHGDNITG